MADREDLGAVDVVGVDGRPRRVHFAVGEPSPAELAGFPPAWVPARRLDGASGGLRPVRCVLAPKARDGSL